MIRRQSRRAEVDPADIGFDGPVRGYDPVHTDEDPRTDADMTELYGYDPAETSEWTEQDERDYQATMHTLRMQ